MKKKYIVRKLFLCLFLGGYNVVDAADLLSVYHDALTNSPILATDLNTALATSQAVPINLGYLLPQVSAAVNTNINNFQTQGINTNYNNKNYSFTLTQPVFNYTALADLAVGNYNKKAAMATYQSQQQQFILDVSEAYFNVLAAEYDLALALAQYNFLQKTMQEAQKKFSAGLTTYTDVVQARANADSAYATLVQSKNNLAITNENLWTFTGVEEKNLATPIKAFPVTAPMPANLDYWVRVAEIKNPLLLAQQYTESAALANVHASVGNQLPTIFVQATYVKNYYNSNVPALLSTNAQTLDKTLSLGLSWNVFSGGELMSQTLQAADQYVAQENTSTNLYRQTQNQTTQDYLNVLASIAQIRAYQQSQISALVSLKKFNAQYKVGAATIVDVLNAVQTFYQARFNLIQAMNQYVDSTLSLKTDVGTLTEKDLVQLNQYLQVKPDSNLLVDIS
jgi:outer membrane protein